MALDKTPVKPLIQWRCKSSGDSTSPAQIRCTLDPADDLTKGEIGHPTFVPADTSTGMPSHYIFGSSDFIGDWPEMPDEYTVCAVVRSDCPIALAGSGDNGKIFRSTDYGETWTEAEDPSEIRLESLATFSNGVALVGSYSSGKIFRSTDYGATWTEVEDTSEYTIQSLATFSNGIVLAGRGHGKIFRSTDYGITWAEVEDTSESTIQSLATFSNGVALAGSCCTGKIFRSTDYGTTWIEVEDTSEVAIRSLATFSNGVALAGSYSGGKIFRSIDYGATWTEIEDTSEVFIYSLATFSNGIALAGSGYSGKIFRSTDYGATWMEIEDTSECQIYCLATISNGVVLAGSGDTGLAGSGDNGKIFRSTDYGVTWAEIEHTTEAYIRSIATFSAPSAITDPYLWVCNDETIENALTTSREWSGSLYRLAIFEGTLSEETLELLRYWWVHRVPRRGARGIEHRLILEGACSAAVLATESDPEDRAEERIWTAADMTFGDDGAEFTSSPAGLRGSVSGGEAFSASIYGDFDFSDGDSGLVGFTDGTYFSVSISSGIVTAGFCGSTLEVPQGTLYVVTAEPGEVPKFYVDGQYIGEGTVVSPAAFTLGAGAIGNRI